MVEKLLNKGKKLFTSPQSSVLSAASIIMIMVVASRILGLVRQRVLAHFFAPGELALYFAAFRLPDTLFEVLVFGTFSAAFIPVFTKTIKKGRREAWEIASTVTNIGLVVFVILATLVIIFAEPIYSLVAPGYTPEATAQIASIARILFAAQGLFVMSYVLTAVLESLRRFLIPAIAPLFYNLGIIIGSLLFAEKIGLMAPALGALIGAALHFSIQLPLAYRLGFRFRLKTKITASVKKIGRLAVPRLIEVSFMQVARMTELFLASLISTASYTFFTFGNTLQLLPVGLFGTSIAKAALPTLARQADSLGEFQKTLFTALKQSLFLIAPIATILIVLRVPIVRLVYGTDIFSWEATVQTGMVVSAFAFGVSFQAVNALMARAFYALHNTKTPVVVSISAIAFNILADFFLIRVIGLSVWGLAAAFSLASFLQACALFVLLSRRIGATSLGKFGLTLTKFLLASIGSGSVMYFLLKIFDRSVWVKRLSFLGKLEVANEFPFERFVLDTRYTHNLLILTLGVSAVGVISYLIISIILKVKEVSDFFSLLKRVFIKRKLAPVPSKESETVTPTPTDTTSVS
jgi:putative peptidoglycan lipid II flippase